MSDEKKTKRGSTPPEDKAASRSDKDLGHALRSVYSSTVNEEIPPELLDLLGKLQD